MISKLYQCLVHAGVVIVLMPRDIQANGDDRPLVWMGSVGIYNTISPLALLPSHHYGDNIIQLLDI